MATSLYKWENKLLFHHRHVKRFHMVKRLRKSVEYVQRYSTKYDELWRMESFSTSVFKVLVWIFATTTKICTRGGSTRAHAQGFDAHRGDLPTRRRIVRTLLHVLRRRSGIGPTLERHPFSGLVDSAGELLHTP